MAKIKKTVMQAASNDRDTIMRVNVEIDVNADGWFTTTLSNSDAELIKSYGIDLEQNRAGRLGFFKNEPMSGLLSDIGDVLRKCLDYKIISQVPVIKYNLDTFCSYCLHNQTGDIVPNGRFVGDGDYNWKEGTAVYSHFETRGFGIKISARPYMKRVVEYNNGKQKTFYDQREDWDKGSYMEWLNAVPERLIQEEYKREIDGTEEYARFFVMIIKQICRINEQIGGFIKNDKLEDLIQRTLKLEVL